MTRKEYREAATNKCGRWFGIINNFPKLLESVALVYFVKKYDEDALCIETRRRLNQLWDKGMTDL